MGAWLLVLLLGLLHWPVDLLKKVSYVTLGIRTHLRYGFFIQLFGFVVVLCNAITIVIKPCQIDLGDSMSLRSRFFIPMTRLFVILGNATTVMIKVS